MGAALSHNSSLTDLRLGSNPFDSEAFFHTFESLTTNRSITTVDMISVSVSPEDASTIAEALRESGNWVLLSANGAFGLETHQLCAWNTKNKRQALSVVHGLVGLSEERSLLFDFTLSMTKMIRRALFGIRENI